jgi:thiol:disulfide interchange protein DsbC
MNSASHLWALVQGSLPFLARQWRAKISFAVLFLLAVGVCSPASAACPAAAQIEAKFQRLMHKKARVLAIRPAALPFLCEVVVENEMETGLFYTDMDGSHFFFGNIINAVKGNNLTEEALAYFNRLTNQDMEELAILTAFSIGKDGSPFVYYVTDPQCPYCKQGEDDLKKLVASGNLQVRFLLFPFESHDGAMEQCVSVVCDQKGLEEFEDGYRSEHQCEEGRLLVESTVDFLRKNGIDSTPTYIFSNGRVHSGFLKMPNLLQWLNPLPLRETPVSAGSVAPDKK